MITPKEIIEQSSKWWKDVLVSTIESNNIFPKEITRIGKISSKDILNKLSDYKDSIDLLKSRSKEFKGLGYKLVLIEKTFDKIGKQQVPEKIVIESIEDFLKLLSKEKEYQIFLKNYTLVQKEIPALTNWIKSNPFKLIDHATWHDTLKVCRYFLNNPRPGLYIRQLPIDVHTKYIIENKAIIQSLLDYLLPDHTNKEEGKFELRYNLKYAEPLIRIRFLDNSISPIKKITDLSMTLSEFQGFNSDCANVFVTENIMNFLTLPELPKTIAIWSGGGFNVSYLKDIQWINTKQFLYWGDLDAQGFQILNQFRTYFPNTVAVMMDEETLNEFKPGTGEPCTNQNLRNLTEIEFQLYQFLRNNNKRLEQEKITQSYAESKIRSVFVQLPNTLSTKYSTLIH